MTQNQINYHNVQETKRHNLATEVELGRHQKATEELTAEQNRLQAEKNRLQSEANALQQQANIINQSHYERMDIESQRSHVVNEGLQSQYQSIQGMLAQVEKNKAEENARHNAETERINASYNNAMIIKSFKEGSQASANAGLIREKTKTEGAQLDYVNAQTGLVTAQTDTEKTKPSLNQSSTFANYAKGTESYVRSASYINDIIQSYLGSKKSKSSSGSADFDRFYDYVMGQ